METPHVIVVNGRAKWNNFPKYFDDLIRPGDELKVIVEHYKELPVGSIATIREICKTMGMDSEMPFTVDIPNRDTHWWIRKSHVVPHGDLARRLNFEQKSQEIKVGDKVKLISDKEPWAGARILEGKLRVGEIYTVIGVSSGYLNIKEDSYAIEKEAFELLNTSFNERSPKEEEYRFKAGDNVMLSSEISSLSTSEAYWVRQRIASGDLETGTVYTVAKDQYPGSKSIKLIQDPKEYNLEAACFVFANYQSSIKTNDNGNKTKSGTGNTENFIQIPGQNIVIGRGEEPVTGAVQRRKGKICVGR